METSLVLAPAELVVLRFLCCLWDSRDFVKVERCPDWESLSCSSLANQILPACHWRPKQPASCPASASLWVKEHKVANLYEMQEEKNLSLSKKHKWLSPSIIQEHFFHFAWAGPCPRLWWSMLKHVRAAHTDSKPGGLFLFFNILSWTYQTYTELVVVQSLSCVPVIHFLPVCSNSCPLSQWCHPAISSSVTRFSSCRQSLPASGSFPVSRLFTSGGQSIGASASGPVLPMNIQHWFPLELTGLIFLLSKGLTRVFSNTTIQKHQFFGTQPSFWSTSHMHTWLREKPQLWVYRPLLAE